MSNTAFHNTIAGTDKLSDSRAGILDSFGQARQETVEGDGLIVGDKTLDELQDIALFDTSAAGRTATLPASPVKGDDYEIGASSASNDVTVDRNGSNINSVAADGTVTGPFASKHATFIDATVGWWLR